MKFAGVSPGAGRSSSGKALALGLVSLGLAGWALVSGAFAGWLGSAPARGVVAAALPSAEYVEARDCTVFGGACHVNGEVTGQGRSALLAWNFGAAGRVVAAVESDENLGRGGARRAVLYVDGLRSGGLDEVTRAAGLTVVAVHQASVTWQRSGDQFHVAVEDVLELTGAALADRSCCTMPGSVWYAPLANQVSAPVVGNPSRCRFVGGDGLVGWRYEDANTAFVGTFEPGPRRLDA